MSPALAAGIRVTTRAAAVRLAVLVLAAMGAATAAAEQSVSRHGWSIHYVAVNSTFLNADIAAHYGLVRGRDRAFINLSAIDPTGQARRVTVEGGFVNLLGMRTRLTFEEVAEGDAVYYLAPFAFEDGEHLRFEIDVVLPDAGPVRVRFEQPLYQQP